MKEISPKNLPEALEVIRVLLLNVRELQENIRDLQKTVQTLREDNQALQKDNQALREENKKLKARLNKNSKNSSKPPSSDFKGNSDTPEKLGGAKFGHKGHFRALMPSNEITKKISIMPNKCPRCGSGDLVSERKPCKHQVIDIPEIKPSVTEYRLERCRCLECGKHVRADLPRGLSQSVLGANLTALIADLSCRYSLPIRKIQRLLHDLLGCSFSPATIIACQQRISASLSGVYEELKKDLQNEAVLNADETGWRTRGKRRWAWIATGKRTTVLMLRTRRNRECAEELLGKDSVQPVITDRYAAYDPKGPHQLCLAHWKRDIEALKNLDQARGLYELLHIDLKEVFSIWRAYQDGYLDEKQFLGRTYYRRKRMNDALKYWVREGPTDQIRMFCKKSLKKFEKYWTYIHFEEMEPTNNRAERELRPLVIRRKISFGTKSLSGEEFIERAYSVAQTLTKRGIKVWQYFRESIERSWASLPAPSLQFECV